MRKTILLCGLLVCGGALRQASAAPVYGTFDMSGIVIVTATSITWQSDVSPNLPDLFTLSGGAGSFVDANGQNEVDTISFATEPVGSTFTPQPFITFDIDPSLPTLDIDYISPGTGGSAGCSAVAAGGETCTPTSPGDGSLTFTDITSTTSKVTFDFSGVTSDGLSSWSAMFTALFNVSYQTVLQGSSVTDSYSATPDVMIPEPGGFVLAGLGLAALWSYRRKTRE